MLLRATPLIASAALLGIIGFSSNLPAQAPAASSEGIVPSSDGVELD